MREYKLYIDDIKEAITKIQSYIQGMTLNGFKSDSKTYDSVLHNLTVIGEAATKIPVDIRNKKSDINWSGIIGMRNIIAHGYFSVDPDIIWTTITERLPELMEDMKDLH